MYRWLFYTVNGLGLGHLTRSLALARQLRLKSPQSQFLFLTTSEAEWLIWQEGFASVKVPSRMACQSSGVRYGTYNRLLHTIVVNTIGAFHPHILVVDTFPAGSAQELLPVLRWDGKRVFIYREQKQSVCADSWFQQLLTLYDQIIIPHHQGEIDLPVPDGVPVSWTTPMLIRSRSEALSRSEARQNLQLPSDRFLVYIGFGGGGEPEYQQLLNWVLAQANYFPDWYFVYARPPLSRANSLLIEQKNFQSISYYPLAECWQAFDGAISAAGYNSVAELLHHGVPTIWIPLERQLDEQEKRATRIVEQNAGWLVKPYDQVGLKQALLELAQPEIRKQISAQAENMVTQNGAELAANYLWRSLF